MLIGRLDETSRKNESGFSWGGSKQQASKPASKQTTSKAKKNSPMHEHSATAIEAVLDEAVGGGQVDQQVLVFDVVDLDDHVGEGAEQVVV